MQLRGNDCGIMGMKNGLNPDPEQKGTRFGPPCSNKSQSRSVLELSIKSPPHAVPEAVFWLWALSSAEGMKKK